MLSSVLGLIGGRRTPARAAALRDVTAFKDSILSCEMPTTRPVSSGQDGLVHTLGRSEMAGDDSLYSFR